MTALSSLLLAAVSLAEGFVSPPASARPLVCGQGTDDAAETIVVADPAVLSDSTLRRTREIVSVVRAKGKRIVGAELGTAQSGLDGRSLTPFDLKACGDLMIRLGVNRFRLYADVRRP